MYGDLDVMSYVDGAIEGAIPVICNNSPMILNENKQVNIKEIAVKEWGCELIESVKTLCLPAYSIIAAAGLYHLDFLSIDVEGLEFKILQTIPFIKLDIKVSQTTFELLSDTLNILKSILLENLLLFRIPNVRTCPL